MCRDYDIFGIRMPDRWVRVLNENDPTAIVAYLLSTGSTLLGEFDLEAKFAAKIQNEIKLRYDASVPIPNAVLYFLREIEWIPDSDGNRRRPSESC